MSEQKRTVTIIPARINTAENKIKRQLRVAAYCRVSTEEEEQLSSYEAQCKYYTEKIMSNPEWTMAGIYADEDHIKVYLYDGTEIDQEVRK